jgi:enoyl-CoA hydratase
MTEAKALAHKLAAKPPVAIQQAKAAINAGIDMDLDNGCRYENEAFALTFATEDKEEGMTAFLEKREAKFTGK